MAKSAGIAPYIYEYATGGLVTGDAASLNPLAQSLEAEKIVAASAGATRCFSGAQARQAMSGVAVNTPVEITTSPLPNSFPLLSPLTSPKIFSCQPYLYS